MQLLVIVMLLQRQIQWLLPNASSKFFFRWARKRNICRFSVREIDTRFLSNQVDLSQKQNVSRGDANAHTQSKS